MLWTFCVRRSGFESFVMENSLRDMDIRPAHLGEMRRRKRSVLPVHTIGVQVGKKGWIRRSFETMNISFILAGGGRYFDGEEEYRVEAPCVITQWPGEFCRYGPDGAWSAWDELYFTYAPTLRPAMEAALLADRRRPVWAVDRGPAFDEALRRLGALTRQGESSGWVERVDFACEALIMESRPLTPRAADPDTARVAAIRAEVDRAFAKLESVDALAARHGLSRSVFRRLWSGVSEIPPQRYLAEAKLRHACRLLVETELTVGEVAYRVGYRDPLYFSRKFRRFFGTTATEYRRRNRPSDWLGS